MAHFGRINSTLWTGSRKWRALGDEPETRDDARLLYLYLHTSPHRTTGTYVLPMAYVTVDLSWELDRVRRALDRLTEVGLIVYDDREQAVHLVAWVREDGPTNGSHWLGIMRLLSDLPDGPCKAACLEEMRQSPHCIRTAMEPHHESVEEVLEAAAGPSVKPARATRRARQKAPDSPAPAATEDLPLPDVTPGVGENHIGNRVNDLWRELELPVPRVYDWLQGAAQVSALQEHWSDEEILSAVRRIHANPDLAWASKWGPAYLTTQSKGRRVIEIVLEWDTNTPGHSSRSGSRGKAIMPWNPNPSRNPEDYR